jgi:hypothetical protein
MATSSRQSTIFGVNDWKTIYKTFSQADFQSYDYETLRKSFIDYLRTYYPETFNDYIESSEYVALLDVIAFMGQAVAFRDDLNTRENFIDTAERRDSVIKLANLVNYNPKRNSTAQGFLKITSVSTTENVADINGLNLSGIPIIWNDPANSNWQEQFNAIMNATLVNSQRIGRPGNSSTILNIKTDEYSIQIPTSVTPTIPFSATVGGVSMNFEGVSATSINQEYVYEVSPKASGKFNILYRNDKLGFGSANNGFFMYFKQGSLLTYDFSLTQQISNQLIDIGDIQGINETDTWLYKINPITQELTEWKQVDNLFANAELRTESSNKTIFSVKSKFNDQVSYLFGDGIFSEIPLGSFRSFVRSSNALQYSIDPVEIQGTTLTFTYISRVNRQETLSITVELMQPVNNAQTRESIADIKLKAPVKYYSQNRMVNGEDYNNFPYTLYSSIIKSKSVNRSSIGVSRNFDLLDPTGKYSSTNSFAEDGALYLSNEDQFYSFSGVAGTGTAIKLFTNQILSIASSRKLLQYYAATFPRYSGIQDSAPISWKQTSYDATNVTGFFVSQSVSIPVGIFNSSNMKYVTAGSQIKFVAPSGFYFKDNRLVSGSPNTNDSTYLWTNVINVVDDGYNGGIGNLANGLGPISLSQFVPSGALVDIIIPAFDNVLPRVVVQNIIDRFNLEQSFTLNYVNSIPVNLQRWFVSEYSDSNFLINFKSLGNGRYLITNKAITYYFGSVKDTRFIFDNDKIIFDPASGISAYDSVTVLKTNALPNSSASLGMNTVLSVIGKTVEADGYPDDYSIEISSIDPKNNLLMGNPDFFSEITGFVQGSTNTSYFVFLKKITDANMLLKNEIVPTATIVSAYETRTQIEVVKYEYPIGQVFFAYSENKFYQTVIDSTAQNILNLSERANYAALIGRQGLFFQYKHNSNNTTRIDPATTNIIDLYLVTQSYYTQYQNWLNDTTGALIEPTSPTMDELSQSYSKINDYKMLSDSVIFNSVKFKPLFGSKAEPKLRATLKVIKASVTTASDSEIRSAVLSNMNIYFSIRNWDFGDTFYFSELSAYLHSEIGDLINSVVLVPNDPSLTFGDLYEIRCAPFEIFVNGAQATDVVVISALTANELQT